MNKINFLDSTCRHCRFYQPEGRRGGLCQKLSVPVDSNWEACILACSPFPTPLKQLEEIVHLETSFSLKYGSSNSSVKVEPNSKIIAATTAAQD